MDERVFVTRGGDKLRAALDHFHIEVTGLICADLGSHEGGFVDCLLQYGAKSVYAVDTSYGTLAWKLRKDPRVIVHERTNAIHVVLPEKVDVVTIDVGWTPQHIILPNARKLLAENGSVISLIKPHYEAPKEWVERGVLIEARYDEVVAATLQRISSIGWEVRGTIESPIRGHAGNREILAWLVPTSQSHSPRMGD